MNDKLILAFLAVLAVAIVTVIALLLRRRPPASTTGWEGRDDQQPPPSGPPLTYEIQEYDATVPDKWVRMDDGHEVRRVEPQWIPVDSYQSGAEARRRLADLVDAARDPARFRVVGTIAADRSAGVRAISADVMRAAPPPHRKDPNPVPQPRPPQPVTPAAVTGSLYEQIGGEVALRDVIKGFYRRVMDDGRVNWLFLTRDMNTLIQHQVRAFTILTGGPNPKRLTEEDIRDWVRRAHARLGINDEHFTILGQHLVDEIQAAGAGRYAPTLAEVFESFRPDVVTAPTPAPTSR